MTLHVDDALTIYKKQLGAGGECEIFEATYNGEKCIAKRGGGTIRLYLEADILPLFADSPRVIKLVRGYEDDDRAICIEYCAGGSLAKFVEKRAAAGQRVSYEEAVGVIKQLLEALSAVHGKNVVHCDISPGNILLRQPGSLADVVLSDFSAAENLNDAAQTPYTTASGTDGFASRRMRNNESRWEELWPADKHSDYYSVGAVLHYLLAADGEYPPSSETLQFGTSAAAAGGGGEGGERGGGGGDRPLSEEVLAEWRAKFMKQAKLSEEQADKAIGFIRLTMRDDMRVDPKDIFGYAFF